MIKVSVIIATRNEASNIRRCLDSLSSQSYENLEIIVIDFGSYDNTIEIAKKYTDLVMNIKEYADLSKVKNYRGAQINYGVSISSGEIIFFPDADMTFDEDLILEVVRKSNEFDAFYIPEIIVGNGYFGKIRKFERSFYNMTCVDAIRFVRKDVFNKLNGFDTKNIKFGPDDWDFTKTLKKNNYRLGITRNSLYHNEQDIKLKNYLLKKSEYINTFKSYIAKWGNKNSDIKKQFSFFYRYFGIFIENKKWIKLLRHPLLTIGLYYIKFLIGILYFTKKFKVYFKKIT
ncbi:MAG: glycosyltransferase family 2 protein [Candidatus Humimicrobiaceae bacterium]